MRKLIKNLRQDGADSIFVLPAIFFFALILIYPVIYTIRLSFYEWSGFGNPWEIFVSFQNFITLFTQDQFFKRAIINTISFTIGETILMIVIGFCLALLVDSLIKGKTFFRTTIFLPLVLSVVLVGLLWANLLSDPQYGLFNKILGYIGLSNFQQVWLGQYPLSLIIIIIAAVWHQIGFSMVVYLAGLQGIPAELTEAARVDGATYLQVVRHVTIPLLKSTTGVVLALIIISGLKVYDYVFVMTKGGPAHMTEVFATYLVQKGFVLNKMGEASAIAVLLMVIAIILGIFFIRVTSGEER
ncbi:MAG: sugar ABC transporter permease [Actinobacteria bacterium]|nr:sugar ABC transporter permease [Actinomycetota bacterium]